MIKKVLYILSVFLLLNANNSWCYWEVPNGFTINHIINRSLGEFRFSLASRKKYELTIVERIDVYNANNKKLQSIKVPEYAEPPCEGCELLEFEDLNFDGYYDLLVLVAWGSHGSTYDIWLFNPKTGLFQKSKNFDSLQNYTIDAHKKEITESIVMSAFEGTTNYYKVINNNPILYKTRETWLGENGTSITEIKVKSHGKWKTVSKKVEQIE